ncbi:MAG: PQQ-binding-like beta-propeller repeat protein [Chloroflexota bacterium]
MSKKIIPLAIAAVLACLVMVVAGAFAFSGSIAAEKVSSSVAWQQPYNTAESMKIIDLTGDGQDELFIQTTDNLSAFDGGGNYLFGFGYTAPKTTLGDVDGDNVEDILVFYPGGVDLIRAGQVSTLASGLGLGTPARIALIRFASGTQILLGDTSGNLLSLSLSGQPLWQYPLGSDEIRGLDEAAINGQAWLAAASRAGVLAVFDEAGNPVWQNATETLRRMRAFDLNSDGTSEIIFGGEYGAFAIYNAADGSALFSTSLGQAVSEVREVELDGDPSAREIVAGGKEGGVWAFSYTGQKLWSASLSDKVTEIAGIDLDGDGAEEAVLGDDSGQVAVFSKDGTRNNLPSHSSGITRIDVGKLNGQRYVAIADYDNVEVHDVQFDSLPGFQYTPLVVGLIVAAVIMVIAGVIASLPAKPETKVAIQDTSREALEAQRRMLKESIADVERLRKSGEMGGDAYLARLKRLRGDLAENEAAFKTAGYAVKVETFHCPHCGGALELGMDKCEYCGQVLLT